jgi:hypothetical protein
MALFKFDETLPLDVVLNPVALGMPPVLR